LADENLILHKDLQLDLTMRGNVDIIKTGPRYYVDYVTTNLSWYPRTGTHQTVETMTTDPTAIIDDVISFHWDQPTTTNLQFRVQTSLTTRNDFVKVQKRIPFPLRNLPLEMRTYLDPGEISDSTPEITQLAQDLAEGQTDLYQVVFNLADWTKQNINYELTTTNVDATQKASWVLANRQGVCDELTSLFISLNRALGIPAKFVSGVSWTDLDSFDRNWLPHGWAEVYFPGVGWVPFDVTYREMGYLDAAHIKLKETPDAKDSSVNYVGNGRDMELRTHPMEFDVVVKDKGAAVPPLVKVSLALEHDTVSIGSYNLLKATVENPWDFYLTADLMLSNTQDIELVDGDYRTSLLLAPKSKRTLLWIIRVSPDLSRDYRYTFPMELRDIRGATAKASFQADRNTAIVQYNDVQKLIKTKKAVDTDDIRVACESDMRTVYIGDDVRIDCTVTSQEDKPYQLNLCFDDCEAVTLAAYGSLERTYEATMQDVGVQTLIFEAKNNAVKKASYIVLDVLDPPDLTIYNVSAPSTMAFGEEGEIAFTLMTNSEAPARNVEIHLVHPYLTKDWKFDQFSGEQRFIVYFYGNNLKYGDNTFTIRISYEDEHGARYTDEQSVMVRLDKANLWQRFILWAQGVEHGIFN
ncbi:MAG: transglutaminase domain-containing protein, partial [Nanoarchaeota archaeon]